MNRFNTAAGAAAAPTAPSAPANPYFTKGNPGSGIPATQPGEWWFHMISEEIRQVISDAGLTPDHTNLTQLSAAISALITAGVSAQKIMQVSDQKAANTDGGACSATTNHTRVLNTVDINTIPSASLASNQITLPAGTYDVLARAPCTADQNRAYLYNVTDSAVALLGGTNNSGTDGADRVTTDSLVVGRITIAGTKVFELRHYTAGAFGIGFGTAVNDTRVEVYSVVQIKKVA